MRLSTPAYRHRCFNRSSLTRVHNRGLRSYCTGNQHNTTIISQQPRPQQSVNAVPRHFIAIFPPTEVLDTIEDLQQKLTGDPAVSRIKWTSRHNLHITLKFLGSSLADPHRLETATKILTEIVSTIEPFELELTGMGVFPRVTKPRVLWLGLGKGKEKYNLIVSRLEKELGKLGIAKEFETREEKHKGHMTIGRWNELYSPVLHSDMLKEKVALTSSVASFTVKEVLIMNSKLHPDEPVYEPIFMAPLRKAHVDPQRRRVKCTQFWKPGGIFRVNRLRKSKIPNFYLWKSVHGAPSSKHYHILGVSEALENVLTNFQAVLSIIK